MSGPRRTSSVDPAELERFSRYAADWWNPRGSMAPLHKFNPVRLAFIRDQVAARLFDELLPGDALAAALNERRDDRLGGNPSTVAMDL